ncbi:MAG: imidazoleglycerol-phosphate dehydratase HisB [Verrucomicrobiales bacterium]
MSNQQQRTSSINRETAETKISISLGVDGTGRSEIDTGIPFLDHMLTLFAKHSLSDLEVKAVGDIDVDYHHTVEDVGIVLGQCFREALGDKSGIVRYGSSMLPMDETLARVVIDFSGRPFLEHRVPQKVEAIRDFPFQLVEEFMRGFANNAAVNLHTEILYGRDAHHMAEALFKGLARATDAATQIDPRVTGVPSTKDLL